MKSLILTITLYLQLVITRVATLPLISTQKPKIVPSKQDSLLSRIQGSANTTYHVKLYAFHTGLFVQVTRNNINALAKEDGKYAELVLTTHNFQGHLSIQGKHSKKFICMNNTGRIILEKNFNAQLCTFFLIFHELGYHTFSSVNNTKWFLGFKQNGLIKHGHRTKSDHNAARMMIEIVP